MRKPTKGRTSIAALLTPSGVMPRMPAPYNLTGSEAEIWERIVNSMPADHFAPGNASVLAQLCRHIAASDRVAMLIEAAAKSKKLDVDNFTSLLRSQIAESVVINRLARSMRLTQQALMRCESAKLRPIADPTSAPWLREEDKDEVK